MIDSPNVWILMYEQMPPVLRWLLTILTGGLLYLIALLYKRHVERIQALESVAKAAATRREMEVLRREMATGTRETHKRLDDLMFYLVKKNAPDESGAKSEERSP